MKVPLRKRWRSSAEVQKARRRDVIRTRHIAQLESQVHVLSTVLDNLQEAVVAVDRAGLVLHVNPAAERLLGIDAATALGSHMYAAVPNDAVCGCIEQVLRSDDGADARMDAVIERPLGGRDLTIHASRLRAGGFAEGEAEGAVAVVQDLTSYRRLETARADFFTNVSHELKTPITAIRGIVETMRDDPEMERETRARFLDKALGQAGRLTQLVTDLLALSRLESDPGALVRERVDVARLASESIAMCSAAAEQAGVVVTLSLPGGGGGGGEGEGEGADVLADEEAVRQALSNLVVNAVQHSERGATVEVVVAREHESVSVTVADTGHGIGAEHVDRIFERFYRADPARSRERGGTGLGLSIVKHVAIAHGGEAGVSSEPGAGSTFYLRLPAAADTHGP